jgi:hypothetical protein
MEQITRHPAHELQHEILERLCRQAEERLSSVSDLDSALLVRAKFCERLEQECVSAMIISGARSFIDGMIADRWGRGDVQMINNEPPAGPA